MTQPKDDLGDDDDTTMRPTPPVVAEPDDERSPRRKRPTTNTDLYENTAVTPPMFPAVHPTEEPVIADAPPPPVRPVARRYRRWIMIGMIVIVPVLSALATRACVHRRAAASAGSGAP